MRSVALAGLATFSLAQLVWIEGLASGLVFLFIKLEGAFNTHGGCRRLGSQSRTCRMLGLHVGDRAVEQRRSDDRKAKE
jgi:hypothetical protein